MQPLDYGRSFLTGQADWNEVRFWVESRTRIIDERTGQHEDYIQCASCKSEDTFAEKDLFYEDNYDFLPIFGPKWGVIFRRRVYLSDKYRSCPQISEMWGGQRHHLVAAPSRELTTNEAIREATYACLPIVSQTEIWNEQTKLRAIIECPVKTLNTVRQKNIYQVDTGPLAFPDLALQAQRHVDRISLAFVAFNVPHFADFVIEVVTPVLEKGTEGKELARVYHYSQRVSLPARNRLYALEV